MSVKRSVSKSKLSRRPKVGLTPEEEMRLKAEAGAAGLEVSAYIRHLLLAAWGEAPAPRPRKFKLPDEILHLLNQVYVQMKRDGSNLNQLARQANAGLVAVNRNEMVYINGRLQENLSAVKAVVEKLAV